MATDTSVPLEDRIARLRTTVMRELNEVFSELADMADPESIGGLVTLAARYERERDEARARIEELESELRSRPGPLPNLPASNAAIVADAARTLRSACAGISTMPMTHPEGAKIMGLVNKAVVAFDDQTKGLL